MLSSTLWAAEPVGRPHSHDRIDNDSNVEPEVDEDLKP